MLDAQMLRTKCDKQAKCQEQVSQNGRKTTRGASPDAAPATHNTAAASFKLNRDRYVGLSRSAVSDQVAGGGSVRRTRRLNRVGGAPARTMPAADRQHCETDIIFKHF
jgi:hypothetical protein